MRNLIGLFIAIGIVSESDKFLNIKIAKRKVVVICLYKDNTLIIEMDLKIDVMNWQVHQSFTSIKLIE